MSKRGESIWKRSDGRWEARFIKARTSSGKAIYASVYAKTYAEVKNKRNDAVGAIKEEKKMINPQVSIGYAINEYLISHQFSIKISTYARYTEIAETYLYPKLKEIALCDFTQDDANEFSAYLQTEGKITGGGLAPKTVKDIISLLKLVFKYAEERKYVMDGKLNFVVPKQLKPQIQIFTIVQQKKLEEYIGSDMDLYKFGIYLCLYTGLRLGEVCALKWSDIDCQNATLSVRRTVLRVKNTQEGSNRKTQLLLNSPKTASSERMIPLPDVLNNMLKELKDKTSAVESSFLLTNKTKFIEPRNYYEHYKRYLESCDLSGFNFHALRHTFATRCIEAGIDPKVISEILGHASVKITLDR